MKKNGAVIRQASDKDASIISGLIFNIWLNEYGFKVNREDFPDLQHIQKYYHEVGGEFMVSIIDDEIVGTIACSKLNEAEFVLKRMFVHKAYRGMGIAQSLLNTLFDEVLRGKKHSELTFYLSTKESEALAAKEFYLKNKFKVIGKAELPDGFPYFYEDDLFMVRGVPGYGYTN